jgi:hypothetical protein
MPFIQNEVNTKCFNRGAKLPFDLRLKDFEMAMQDVYDFFYDVNLGLIERGLQRLDDMLRPAIMSGVLSDKKWPRKFEQADTWRICYR